MQKNPNTIRNDKNIFCIVQSSVSKEFFNLSTLMLNLNVFGIYIPFNQETH